MASRPSRSQGPRSNPRRRRRPNAVATVWALRLKQGFPFLRVGGKDDELVELYFDPAVFDAVPRENVLRLTRSDARLLARRINQMLDATRRS